MIRRLRPCGQFVGARRVGGFTVTAYDLVTRRFIGMGHPHVMGPKVSPIGRQIFLNNARMPDRGGEKVIMDIEHWLEDAQRPIGVITGEGRYGVVGELYDPDRVMWAGDPCYTGNWVPGPAVAYNSLLEGGLANVEIQDRTEAPDHVHVGRLKPIRGMSGTPVVQAGRLVAALCGIDQGGWFGLDCGKGVAVDIEIMADELLRGA